MFALALAEKTVSRGGVTVNPTWCQQYGTTTFLRSKCCVLGSHFTAKGLMAMVVEAETRGCGLTSEAKSARQQAHYRYDNPPRPKVEVKRTQRRRPPRRKR